jgi:signal transduction histidine kinase
MANSYTTIPFLWRRHLAFSRPVIAALGFALYLYGPAAGRTVAAAFLGVYAIWGAWVALRDSAEVSSFPVSLLPFDLLLLFCCASHPSQAGHWLAALALFFLLCTATFFHKWQTVLLSASSAAVLILVARPAGTPPLWLAAIIAGPLAVLLSLQKQLIQDRLSSALRRTVLSRSEAELARENERQRIAADFHDGPLQSFISFQMRLEIIRRMLERSPEVAMEELLQLQELGRAQVTELRSFVRHMQPVEVTAQTLPATIREAVEHFERDSGITAELFVGNLGGLSDDVAPDLLQIVREALNNVRKHSRASRVTVAIETVGGEVQVTVDDDGGGFPFSGSYNLDELELLRLGPRSIKRRVRTLNGQLNIDSRPSSGASLRIRVPAD